MAAMSGPPSYSHIQKAPLYLILYGAAIVTVMVAIMMGEWQGIVVAGGVSLVLVVLGGAFHHFTVEDEGDVLAIRFGPLPLFHKRVWYADIRQVEVGRSLILDCWGMPCTIRGGWVWNLWGRDCVVVQRKDNSILRMGTDDAENPAGFPW